MKFLYALASLLSMASAIDILVQSDLGQNLLSHARCLDQDAEADYTWVSGYSFKFQGCHNIKQWNDDADNNSDVCIATKRLVWFHQCPSTQCLSNKAAGCDSGYGEYFIDLNTSMNFYYKAKQRNIEITCQTHMSTNYNCEDYGTQADNFNEDYCEYNCYNNANLLPICRYFQLEPRHFTTFPTQTLNIYYALIKMKNMKAFAYISLESRQW